MFMKTKLTGVPGGPGRFESSPVVLLLENSDVIGTGPDGQSVLHAGIEKG